MIDCHTHLTSLADGPEPALLRARAAGVDRFVSIGSSSAEMAAVTALAELRDDVYITAGLHPHSAEQWSSGLADEVRMRAAHPLCVAIGETGLDYFRERAPHDVQERAFRGQLALARELDLPVVVHCRDAEEDCFRVLAEEGPETVVLHCFAAADRLTAAVERGWYCSFAGNVTYPSATALQEAVRDVPAELLLLETDAPYLAPVPHRGRPNEPAYVMETLRFVAGIRGLDPAALAAEIDANAACAFGL